MSISEYVSAYTSVNMTEDDSTPWIKYLLIIVLVILVILIIARRR